MIKKLVKGKIYFYKYIDPPWGILLKMNENFSLTSKFSQTDFISFTQLAIDHGYSPDVELLKEYKIVKNVKNGVTSIEEVPLEDLPLYIGMPYKTEAFSQLLKGS